MSAAEARFTLYTAGQLEAVLDRMAHQAAGLVDRCVLRLPVRADIAGIRLQLAPGDVVECQVPPYEPRFAIDLVRH
ncbi:MAG TPA: hypothetical protein DHV08_15745 [Rhodocyclaceae bacterium]|nr:MAG: hypothetical protein AUK49_02815 [Betaproteobacteria bacterium CG2_30_68_42]PIX75472.1 MAG: hypothetical protein COZ38_05380 [Rhodocyclales bacterium CG_4_10_14_3_um_filter_68_10]PJA56433.1 MAG: hypothetical protein CO164_13180 [Rhodocyclales bacterium CG_4_9_14_3_um_filter_68_10]HCX34851.1 hypothetical protein [Rhodocyclaceae bacterium]